MAASATGPGMWITILPSADAAIVQKGDNIALWYHLLG